MNIWIYQGITIHSFALFPLFLLINLFEPDLQVDFFICTYSDNWTSHHNYNKRLEISAMRMSWSSINSSSPLLFFLKETSYHLKLEQKKKTPSAAVALNPHATTKNLKTTCGPPVHRSCVTTTWSMSSPTPRSTPTMLQRHRASIQRRWGFFYKKPKQFSCSLLCFELDPFINVAL